MFHRPLPGFGSQYVWVSRSAAEKPGRPGRHDLRSQQQPEPRPGSRLARETSKAKQSHRHQRFLGEAQQVRFCWFLTKQVRGALGGHCQHQQLVIQQLQMGESCLSRTDLASYPLAVESLKPGKIVAMKVSQGCRLGCESGSRLVSSCVTISQWIVRLRAGYELCFNLPAHSNVIWKCGNNSRS